MAVDPRQTAGLDDERRALAFLEPGEGGVERRGRDQGAFVARADAERRAAAAVAGDDFMAGLGEMARQEPAQQRRAFLVGNGIGIRGHGGLHLRPVGDGGADILQRFGQRLFERATRLSVRPVGFDIDHRFAASARRVIVQHRGQCAIGIAGDGQDGVEQAMDGDVGGRHRIGDRIHQERHVVIDDRQPHETPGGAFAQRLNRDRAFAQATAIGDASQKARRGGERRLVQTFALAR